MTHKTQHNKLFEWEEASYKDMLGFIPMLPHTQQHEIAVCVCVFVCVQATDLELSGSIQRHGQAAEQDYGTTGCGCTLPGGFCVGGKKKKKD